MTASLARRPRAASAGFTLAEAAVTIAVVAIVLTLTLQALEGAKVTAVHTMYQKTANQLGLSLLGEIEAGRFQGDLESGDTGSFVEQGEPGHFWELALGDDVLPERGDERDFYDRPFDNWQAREEWRENNESTSESEEEEEEKQPYEKVKLRITYPAIRQFDDELVLERWVRWEQIYGKDEEEEAAAATGDPNAGSASGNGSAANAAGGSQDQGGTRK